MRRIINLTEDRVCIMARGFKVAYKPSGHVARLELIKDYKNDNENKEYARDFKINYIPLNTCKYKIIGIPEPRYNTVFIVTKEVAMAAAIDSKSINMYRKGRGDLIFPIDPIYKDGKIIFYKGFGMLAKYIDDIDHEADSYQYEVTDDYWGCVEYDE